MTSAPFPYTFHRFLLFYILYSFFHQFKFFSYFTGFYSYFSFYNCFLYLLLLNIILSYKILIPFVSVHILIFVSTKRLSHISVKRSFVETKKSA